MRWQDRTPTAIVDLYTRIRQRRPNWFWACPHMSPEDFLGFEQWVNSVVKGWWEIDDCTCLVEREGHITRFHLAFLGPVDVQFLKDVADADWNVRQEVPLMTKKGLLIRKLLREVGFQKEGILRNKGWYYHHETGEKLYEDIEMWSRLPERSL